MSADIIARNTGVVNGKISNFRSYAIKEGMNTTHNFVRIARRRLYLGGAAGLAEADASATVAFFPSLISGTHWSDRQLCELPEPSFSSRATVSGCGME